MTLRIFIACLTAGLLCGILDGALSPARKKAGAAFTVLTDVLLASLTVGAHAAVLYFLCDGRLFFYALLSQAAGFFTGRAFSHAVISALRKIGRKNAKRAAS